MTSEEIIERRSAEANAEIARLVRQALSQIADTTGTSRAWIHRSYAQKRRFANQRANKGETK
jgi:hypothetical protein